MSSTHPSEARRNILGSAAFRLTLRFAAIFVACLLLLDLIIGIGARWYIEREAKAEVQDQLAELREAFDEGGAAALAGFISEASEEFAKDALVLGYQTADGALLAGALALATPEIGWTVYIPEGIDEDEALWVKSARLSDGTWLNAGASSEFYHDVSELMLAGALWTVVIAFPLALLSGAFLSHAVLRRLAPIVQTTEGVREGELSQRAPLRGTRDEFDRLAEDINAMLDTIEALTRNLRNVSVGIAHELRTPLARIRNRLVSLKEGGVTPDEAGPAIDGSLAEIDGALTTFDALLKIGQIEADSQRKGFELVDFSELVSELSEVYEPVAVEQGKQFGSQLAQGVELRGNRALLAQMISNLLENAIEHTPEGSRITLELCDADAANAGPMLVVQDDGPGIPPGERERIFERFFRLDQSRSTCGNGLGLSLVRSICGLHGFTVRLSPDTSGARFEILI